jgi:hypothetical protein
MRRYKCFQFHNNLHKQFQIHHQKQGQLVTRSPGCKNSEKCDNTKLKGVQLQDERALIEFWDLHHEDGVSMSNLKMISEAIFHSLVQLEA